MRPFAIFLAALALHAAAAGQLLDDGRLPQGPDPAAPDQQQAPAAPELHLAARADDLETIKRLLAEGVDVDLQMTHGEDWLSGSTPLMWATRDGSIATVKFLLDAGANPRMRSANGTTALAWAVATTRDAYEKAVTLIEAGADVNVSRAEGSPIICWAAGLSSDGRIIDLLLDSGADIGARMRRERLTTLMTAARAGNLETLPRILARNPELEARAANGFTALIYAAEGNAGKPEAIAMLAEAGADLEARDDDGLTALMVGARLQHAERVRRLLEVGANPNAANARGETALMFAAAAGDPDSAAVLVDGGADVSARATSGITPLMLAAQAGEPIVVRLLLAKGADPNARSHDGWTALLLARSIATAEPLISAGADLDAQTTEGWTPLHFAADAGDGFLFRALLNAGADATIADKADNTPLTVLRHHLTQNAESAGHLVCLAALEAAGLAGS